MSLFTVVCRREAPTSDETWDWTLGRTLEGDGDGQREVGTFSLDWATSVLESLSYTPLVLQSLSQKSLL